MEKGETFNTITNPIIHFFNANFKIALLTCSHFPLRLRNSLCTKPRNVFFIRLQLSSHQMHTCSQGSKQFFHKPHFKRSYKVPQQHLVKWRQNFTWNRQEGLSAHNSRWKCMISLSPSKTMLCREDDLLPLPCSISVSSLTWITLSELG